MNETDSIQFAQIREYNFKEYFQKFQYNGKKISDADRKDFVQLLDDSISQYSEGLPMIKEGLELNNGREYEFDIAYRTALSVYLFVIVTYIDCLVISKYFLLADTDYDKRFMRGKMKVILNEGFKKLYGFEKNTNGKSKKDSQWRKLSSVVQICPDLIKLQYADLSEKLKEQSETSTWWKAERNHETHLNAEELYESRCEEIEESKVMMDVTKLLNTLYAVQLFLTNVHGCFHNTIIQNCKNQETRNA